MFEKILIDFREVLGWQLDKVLVESKLDAQIIQDIS